MVNELSSNTVIPYYRTMQYNPIANHLVSCFVLCII